MKSNDEKHRIASHAYRGTLTPVPKPYTISPPYNAPAHMRRIPAAKSAIYTMGNFAGILVFDEIRQNNRSANTVAPHRAYCS